ncbi:MAG: aspartate aminotransferase family protein, partial [Thermodesulfobacteriota bacterium]
MTNKELDDLYRKYVMHTYSNYPVVLTRGEGCRVWDVEGKEYLDFLAGIAVCSLGHCHPKLVAAVKDQVSKLIHISNWYLNEPQIRLAQLLVENSFADRAFFCNSGAEANEAAIKLARKWAKETKGRECYEIICIDLAFHGRTLATITASGQEKLHQGFEPLVPGFKYVPFNDLDALRQLLGPATAAIMIEPILGESGIILPEQGYLKEIRHLCDQQGLLLILDEVQMGLGRTGSLFAYQQFDFTPDIMTLAKALGGGVPIGAMLAKEEVASHFGPGTHGSTFGGNPLVCAAAIVSFNLLLEDGVLDNSRRQGAYLLQKLNQLKSEFPIISEVRGKGLAV